MTRVLLVPGGASTVHGYFPLASSLEPDLAVIEVDPPGIGETADGSPLRLAGYAQASADGVRQGGTDPVLAVGHSLGGLIALRLAVDHPELVAGLVLLDPTPLTPPRMLSSMGAFLRVLAALGPVGRRMWDTSAKRDFRDVQLEAETERAALVYRNPRFVAETARWAKHLARDGAELAAELRAGKVTVPTVVVTADYRSVKSAVRRAHEELVSWIPGAHLEVWENTRHPLHIQQPARVAEAIMTLASRTTG
jgi:pimeloyl-ACP methyl ester carboxylesterase